MTDSAESYESLWSELGSGASDSDSEELRQRLRQLARTSSYFLAKTCLGYPDLTPKVHGPICAFVDNPPADFDLMLGFRGSLKSTIATVTRTVKAMIQEKPADVLIFSEAAPRADEWSAEAREAFEGKKPVMRWLFPELQSGSSKTTKWGDSHWRLPNGSSCKAAGIDTQLMGTHVHELIMDDVFSDPKGEKTAEFAQRITNFIRMSRPLLKAGGRGRRHLIGVPWWATGDPYAYFRKELPRAHQFIMPLYRANGELMWPEVFPPATLAELQRDAFVFASQYLLSPVSADTAVFKRDSVRTYETGERPRERRYMRIMTIDPAFSKERQSHRTAIALSYRDAKGNDWIEYAEQYKWHGSDLKKNIIRRAQELKAEVLAIEANGPQVILYNDIKDLFAKFPYGHPLRRIRVVAIKPYGRDKVSRWQKLAAATQDGRVRVRKDLTELLAEMYRVTGAKHEANDLTDAAAHFLSPELKHLRPRQLEDDDDSWLPAALRDRATDAMSVASPWAM